MFKLDNEFLTSLGLGSLPVDEKNKLLQAIYERLEMNVGMRLAEKMTDEQLNEFEGFIDRSDEAGALSWLETNFPNYKQVVAEELEKLRTEVSASAPQILAAAQAAPIQGQPEASQPAQQPMMPPAEQQPAQNYQQPPQSPNAAPGFQQPSPDFTATPQPQAYPQQPQSPPSAPWDQPPASPNQQPPAGFPPQ